MESQRTARRRSTKLAITLAATVAVLGVLELALRAAGFWHPPPIIPPIVWNPEEDRGLREGEGMFRADPAQLWVPIPGAEVPYGAREAERINAAGYRGPLRTPQPPAGVVRIVALGDSSTFGMGVAYSETWCAQLERGLAEAGLRAEVLDLGVIGFTIEQGLERYDSLARQLRPHVVVAAFGAVNEHLWAQTMADRPKIEARKRPDRLREFARAARTQARVLHLAGWVIDRARGQDRAALREAWKLARRQADEFVRDFGRVDWPGERRVSLERFAAALDELGARVRADGASLVLVSMPRLFEDEELAPVLPLYNRAIEAAAARLSVPCLDVRASVLATLAGPPPRAWPELFLDHYHPTPEGHAHIAAGLVPIVSSLPAFDPSASSTASGR